MTSLELFTSGSDHDVNMAAAISGRSRSSSSDESDSFDGLSMNFQPYSFKPNVRQGCEYVDSVSGSHNETNTADSEIMDESQNHENTGSEMDIAQQVSWFIL